MNPLSSLTPKYATHPGEVLLDELEANEISQAEFAKIIGFKKSQLNEIIKGKRNINADLAILLEKSLGIDAEYWLELQKNYSLDKAKIEAKNQNRLEAIENWNLIKSHIATSFLKKEKIITGDPVEDIPIIKSIYNIKCFEGLAKLSVQPNYIRFRQHKSKFIDNKNVIAWVKLVQYNAKQVIVDKFDNDLRNELLNNLRIILFQNNQVLKRTEKTLAEFGIKLIIQNKGSKTPIDGVSFWSEGKPAIGMSLRYKRLDYFAFTLFHELGHIYEHLLNNNQAEYIDIDPSLEDEKYKKSEEEIEANLFAENNLIPPNKWENFISEEESIYNFNDYIINKFSHTQEVNPAIVKGRLCRHFDNYKLKSNIVNEVL
ncbi:HigA family addiction module antitoxin [Marinifilum caeruleilacunae]|uniref:Addiction module antidote protein, HigA family n=1 Tax=Marinifilum caeruleilacunae TaxID=2499076 RepID=A0ABX1WYT8_9BACT|nr:HigA family addiction module antitoxin [Marinifilum caeruleilacunae]NOU61054.1 addiction module antidote protein, HigA family [Marinifilum caeruleilacunae]